MTDLQDITIAFHIGGPQPEVNRLLWSLRKDASRLNEKGVMVRRPASYQKALRDLLDLQANAAIIRDDDQAFISSVVKQHNVSRLVMSDPNFIMTGPSILSNGKLLEGAGPRVQALRQAFSSNRCEFFLGICSPTILLAEAFQRQETMDWNTFLDGTDLFSLRWSKIVQNILDFNADSSVCVWCVEETPLSWPNILKAITGLDNTYRFAGELDIIENIMPSNSYDRLTNYLTQRPYFNEAQRRAVCQTFLDRFCSEEIEVNLTELSQVVIDELSDIYIDDLSLLERMPGVTFIS
jgi:hypothetical protein